MNRIIKLYFEILLNKSTIVTIILINLISIASSLVLANSLNNDYYFNYLKIHNDYLEIIIKLHMLVIMLFVFFLAIHEIRQTSITSMLESSLGRRKIFISKYITYLLIALSLGSLNFISLMIVPFFMYPLFELNIYSYIPSLIFTTSSVTLVLFITHVFKNIVLVLIYYSLIMINMLINNNIFSYFTTTIQVENGSLKLDSPLYYEISICMLIFILDYIVYFCQEHR